MLEFTIFSRPDCHLCDVLHQELEHLCAGRAKISIVDIDSRPEWQVRYGSLIPVLSCAGEEICHYRLDHKAVIDYLNRDALLI